MVLVFCASFGYGDLTEFDPSLQTMTNMVQMYCIYYMYTHPQFGTTCGGKTEKTRALKVWPEFESLFNVLVSFPQMKDKMSSVVCQRQSI